MIGALDYLVVPLVAGIVWHETRVYGRRIDDREYVEAAPVVAGATVLIGYTTVMLLTGTREMLSFWDWWYALVRGSFFAIMTMTGLVGLEAILYDQGLIEHEWLLLPGELQAITQEKLGGGDE